MIIRFDSKRKSESGMHCLKYLSSLHFFNFNSLQFFLYHFSLTNMKLKVVIKHKILTKIIHAEQK